MPGHDTSRPLKNSHGLRAARFRPGLDATTIGVAIQAVHEAIQNQEQLLRSQTLRDRAEIEDLKLSYERAAEQLKEAYLSELAKGISNLPKYEELIDS